MLAREWAVVLLREVAVSWTSGQWDAERKFVSSSEKKDFSAHSQHVYSMVDTRSDGSGWMNLTISHVKNVHVLVAQVLVPP